jgi:uncharacterized membrane protein
VSVGVYLNVGDTLATTVIIAFSTYQNYI